MKIQIERQNGTKEIVEDANFNAVELANKINNSQNLAISIGDQVFSRIEILHVKILSEE